MVASPTETTMPVREISLMADRTLTRERVIRDDSEKVTRTEREYQEVLDSLHRLRRELMAERTERRRSRSRGRKQQQPISRNSQEMRTSTETVRWWLGDVP